MASVSRIYIGADQPESDHPPIKGSELQACTNMFIEEASFEFGRHRFVATRKRGVAENAKSYR